MNQVENHHWFENYNKGLINEKDVVDIFKSADDLEIAKILAKGDFESVNKTFHLNRMNPTKGLSQAEFDQEFAAKMAKIATTPIKNVTRTLQEQLLHLEKNYQKQSLYTDLNNIANSGKGIPIEKFSLPNRRDYWLKYNNELYYVPERPESFLNVFCDDLYSKLGGVKKESMDFGHISKSASVHGFDDTVKGFKYIEKTGSIKDSPTSLYDGFGLDCLFATPLNGKTAIINNGKVVRTNHGLSSFEWNFNKYGNKADNLFTENVSELPKYFEHGSESSKLLKNMTRDDLIKSLDNLSLIDDASLSIKGSSNDNYRFISETLLERKKYISEFCSKLKSTPQNKGESMLDYTKRIEAAMPKTIVYECPMNDHLMKTLPKSEKLILEENYKQYKALSAQKVIHNATDVMEQGSLIHNTPSVNIESMLDNGLVSGQIDIGKKVSSSSVPGNFTSTPAQFDTFKVMNSQNIKDYFNLNNRSSYERGWLPQDSKSSIVTFVINKKSISGAVENSLQYHGSPPGGQNPTHWTIPMGVPVQTVEKIIVHPSLPVSEITNIKSQIAKRGLDIKVFNTDGLLL